MARYERYAIYFVPPADSEILRLADSWLGRCTLTGKALPRPDVPDLAPERIAALTKSAARYGFHATLKAPFRLAPGVREGKLLAAVEALSADLEPAPPVKLRVDELSGFLALRPLREGAAIRAIGNACVTELDHLRAPQTEAELGRRLKAGLSEQQQSYLQRWGYPYVLGQFRFHMTLTGPVRGAEADQFYDALRRYFGQALSQALAIDSICLCGDPGKNRPFECLQRFPLRRQPAARRLAS